MEFSREWSTERRSAELPWLTKSLQSFHGFTEILLSSLCSCGS